ncbi:MAG TPA: hypothetical protein VHS28_02025 [Chloroflexota bacterium]|nr:hypothetical protein [Chloroflexota bacterium]
MTAFVAHTGVDIVYRHRVGQKCFELDAAAIRRVLEGVPITHPAVLQWLDRFVSDGLAELGACAPVEEKDDAKAE